MTPITVRVALDDLATFDVHLYHGATFDREWTWLIMRHVGLGGETEHPANRLAGRHPTREAAWDEAMGVLLRIADGETFVVGRDESEGDE